RDVAAHKRLPGARPHDIVVAWVQGQGANGRNVLSIEDGLPMGAAVGGLEDAAGSGADVVDPRIARNPNHRSSAVADRSNVTIFQLAVSLRRLRPKRN